MEADVYTVSDIQVKYALSRSKAYDYVNKLPASLILRFDGCIRIDKKGFEEFIHQNKKV